MKPNPLAPGAGWECFAQHLGMLLTTASGQVVIGLHEACWHTSLVSDHLQASMVWAVAAQTAVHRQTSAVIVCACIINVPLVCSCWAMACVMLIVKPTVECLMLHIHDSILSKASMHSCSQAGVAASILKCLLTALERHSHFRTRMRACHSSCLLSGHRT